jgi:hypothetical protein
MRASKCMVCALALFACFAAPYAAGQASTPGHSSIRLVVTTSKVRYCRSDSEVYTAQFSFLAEYRNISDQPLTIVLGSEVPSKLIAAANEGDLAAGTLQLQMDLESYPADSGANAILGQNILAEKTATIRPGQSVYSKVEISLPVRSVSKNIPGTVESGRHVLLFEFALRSRIPGSASEGFRWVALRSQPIVVDVPAKQHLQSCGN